MSVTEHTQNNNSTSGRLPKKPASLECPANIFEVRNEDPNDPFREIPVAAIKESERKKIKYACSPCKPVSDRPPLPCVGACKAGAIAHSW